MSLKTEFAYMVFVEVPTEKKTKTWRCLNKGSRFQLGTVAWYAPWRQYCYFNFIPKDDTINQAVFNKGCLDDISSFLESVNALRNEPSA